MRRFFSALVPLAVVAAFVACGVTLPNNNDAAAPSSPAVASDPADGKCDGKTCDECVHGAGCWWRPSSSQCLTDDEAQKASCIGRECVNDNEECE